jgi:hypothetical protein
MDVTPPVSDRRPNSQRRKITMAYGEVDEIINEWAAAHKFTLFDEFGGLACRAVYLSSSDGECCQIWIDPPIEDEICLHAGDVESKDDVEMQMDWQVPVTELRLALEAAVEAVHQWYAR